MKSLAVDTVVLDVDGTLVDSVYTHVQAWSHAFQAIGTQVPCWRIHRAIGMGADRLVTEVAGQRVEQALGDRVRELHDAYYEDLFGMVRALPGADDLLAALRKAGFTVVLASSGNEEQTERAMDLLAASDVASARVSSADVDATKPAPDLVEAAVGRAGGTRAALVGDSVWDVEAAVLAGIPAIGLLCGGFSEAELLEAGAVAVFDSPEDLAARFDESGLAYTPS